MSTVWCLVPGVYCVCVAVVASFHWICLSIVDTVHAAGRRSRHHSQEEEEAVGINITKEEEENIHRHAKCIIISCLPSFLLSLSLSFCSSLFCFLLLPRSNSWSPHLDSGGLTLGSSTPEVNDISTHTRISLSLSTSLSISSSCPFLPFSVLHEEEGEEQKCLSSSSSSVL